MVPRVVAAVDRAEAVVEIVDGAAAVRGVNKQQAQ